MCIYLCEKQQAVKSMNSSSCDLLLVMSLTIDAMGVMFLTVFVCLFVCLELIIITFLDNLTMIQGTIDEVL